jgi:hypothetical protein
VSQTATLELVCGCRQWLLRWTADLGVPFGEQTIIPQRAPGAVHTESPGEYQRASDGKWYRWPPGIAEGLPAVPEGLPDGKIWSRYVFTCSTNGCRAAPQVHIGKLEDAAAVLLRPLHAARVTEPLRLTLGSLLRYSA